MGSRYYGAETRPNSGKKIFAQAQSACPFATSIHSSPLPNQAQTRTPPFRHQTPTKTPWAIGSEKIEANAGRSDIVPTGYMRKGSGMASPARRTAAPYATSRKDEVDAPPSVVSHLDNISRRRPVSAPVMQYKSSVKGTPYGTELNKQQLPTPPTRTASPRRPAVDSVVAPWLNGDNAYEVRTFGKKVVEEKYERPETARERRRAYGAELLNQIKNREVTKKTEAQLNTTKERRMSLTKSMSGLTRGIGERKRWV